MDKEDKKIKKISVREIVEFVLRSGSIDETYSVTKQETAMQLGIKLHKQLQAKREKDYKKEKIEYVSEKAISNDIERAGYTFSVSGRMDGLVLSYNPIIEEIKSTSQELTNIQSPSPQYLAQLKLYGYFYCVKENLDVINLKLTYIGAKSNELKEFDFVEKKEDLLAFYLDILDKYLVYVKLNDKLDSEFRRTSKNMPFPFQNYRKNQYELMGAVYNTIKEKKSIFVQAPTGTGKTISTLYPATKAIEQNEIEKVFYATSKTITRVVAIETMARFEDCGLAMRSIELRAKEKCCLKEKRNCIPEYCEYANGHFDRINEALYDIVNNETIMTPNRVEYYSKKHTVCPYEFSLDITNFCKVVVCDYNNVYNPISKLLRYFELGGKYTILIDESHNLNDRALDMYTSEISTETFRDIKTLVTGSKSKIVKSCNEIIDSLSAYESKLRDTDKIVVDKPEEDLFFLIQTLKQQIDTYLEKDPTRRSEFTEPIFSIIEFSRILEFYGKNYKTVITKINKNYTKHNESEYVIKLMCFDASMFIRQINNLCKGVVFFSATLSPLVFYRDCYGGDANDFATVLSSPFDEKNVINIIDDSVSTYYKNRDKYTDQIASKIMTAIEQKTGNYFVYFSSYAHMEIVYNAFNDINMQDIRVIKQERNLTESQKNEFLENFEEHPKKTTVAFLVLGGMFAEGIDFVGTMLEGVIVVGVGLPKITKEREVMMNYYNEKNSGEGFDYAYTYVGVSKVLQAMGRLIRSETDKGFIMLLDIRFNTDKYLNLLPFENYYVVNNEKQIATLISEFWEQNGEGK